MSDEEILRYVTVSIAGFRCYDKKVIKITPNKITNLSGPSGVGKSTIFSAIYWALFGSLRNIQSHTKNTKKNNVTIEFPMGPKIYRQANPKLLRVTYQDKVTEGDGAQVIIDRLFGSKMVWTCTSYLAQNERNLLLTGNTNDKMDLLGKMSFSDEDIDSHISKIENKVTEIDLAVKVTSGMYSKGIAEYEIETKKVDWDNYVLPEDRQACLDVKDQLLVLIPETQNAINLNNQQKGKLETIKKSIQTVETSLASLTPDTSNSRETLQSNIENILHLLNIQQEIMTEDKKSTELIKIRNEIAAMVLVNPNVDTLPDYKQEDLFLAKTQDSEHSRGVVTCKAAGVLYTKEAVDAQILSLEKTIMSIPNIKKALEYRNIISKLETLPVVTTTQDDINAIRDKIKVIQDSQKSLRCPHCSKGIRFVAGGIIADTIDHVCDAKEIPILQACMAEMSADLLRKTQRDALEVKKRELEFPGIMDIDVSVPLNEIQLRDTLTKLKGVKVVDKPDVDVISSAMKYHALKRRVLDISTKDFLPEIREAALKVSQRDLTFAKDALSRFNKLEFDIKSNTDRLTSLYQELSEISIEEGHEEYLIAITDQLHAINDRIKEWQIMDALTAKRDKLERDKKELDSLSDKLSKVQNLKKIALELECGILQHTVDSVNNSLNVMIANLFDDPISVRLDVFKTPKNSGRVKPCVNLKIHYRGGEYDNIGELSGGEGDRVSLALTLALSQVSGSPIMLLDETMTSLDANIRERCLETLKEHTNKTVLCIDHESIEGYYDEVIHM
jgi:DNA repair exonuclease SbcCD ATPase subunit